MKFRDRIANVLASKDKAANSASVPLGQQFLRYGNRENMLGNWSQVVIREEDKYTGLLYAAIRNRANRVAQLAQENIRTDALPTILDKAKAAKVDVVHPYLELIDSSDSFSNYWFWYTIDTFLDLKGVYYLMAVRTIQGKRVGNIQEFKLLNPYQVQRIRPIDSLEVVGYKETRGGFSRVIPPELIIEIRDLNPFSDDEPYSLADAAKDQQFTLKSAGDYTRQTLQNNVNAPGIISTDLELNTEQMANFKSRITGHVKGEPIFSDGKGNVSWNPMTTDLDKASLDKVSAINAEVLLAVTGMSKTAMGTEVSGVTRDTSKTQSDLLITGQIMPRIQLISDALNQDYKTNYADEYKKNQYRIYLDSPLGTDREAELSDVNIRQESFNLFGSLVDAGYDFEAAARYAAGEITLEELGKPTNDPKPTIEPSPTRVTVTEPAPGDGSTPPAEPPAGTGNQNYLPAIRNALEDSLNATVQSQEGALRNAVINIEERLVMAVMNKVTNAYDSQNDIINSDDRQKEEDELVQALAAFYLAVVPILASSVMTRRLAEFNLPGAYSLDAATKDYIAATAKHGAESHVSTVLDDLLKTVREQALEGKTQTEIISALRKEYVHITTERANVIARTETNRAFTRAQYDADRQFLQQNDLTAKAYKKWVTRNSDPCPFCLAKAAEPAIPFEQAFGDLGDVWTATVTNEDGTTTVKKLPINYETIQSGNAHPNCACVYQLVIEGL
jgi:hypothetical protein